MNHASADILSSRDANIEDFLASSGWGHARRTRIPGDASFRRYERITLEDGKQSILMDAPPGKEEVTPFVTIAEYLVREGFSAPRILAGDTARGLLLLEDLGDDLYSRLLSAASNPPAEESLYLPAIETLAELYRLRPSSRKPIAIPPYDEALYLREAHLLTEWFLPHATHRPPSAETVRSFDALWRETLARLPALPETLVLRDYHADNLLWLAERKGVARVGLLDFQDAVWGNPAYDLVSLLEDARRDVQEQTVQSCKRRFQDMTGLDKEALELSYALLGAQRNTKIIGIFCRLARRDSKPRYLAMLPRVWNHLERDLAHPALNALKAWYDRHIPPALRSSAHG